MIWVGILEGGFIAMLVVALIVAAVHDIRHIREEKRTGKVKCCETCKYGVMSVDDCTKFYCTRNNEFVDEFFWCKKWE